MTRLLITTFLVLLMGLVACTEIVPDDLPDDFFNEDLQASATDWSHYYKFYRCPRDENDRFHTEVLYDVTNETEIDTDVSNEAQTVDRTETKNDTRTVNGTDRCQKNCTGDADCPGTKKCCSVGCDQICVEGLKFPCPYYRNRQWVVFTKGRTKANCICLKGKYHCWRHFYLLNN